MSRDTEAILESLTPAYAADTQASSKDAEWLKIPVDPRLYNTNLPGNHTLGESSTLQATPQRGELLRALPHLVTPKTSPVVKTQIMTPLSEPSPAFVQQPYYEEEGATPQDAETDPGRGTSTSWALRSGNAGRLAQSKRQVRFSNEPDDDSEGEGEPPRKRARAPGSFDDDLGDRRMPYVDNGRQSISSFNVADNEHGHPAAGLCKKCWRAFSDPVAFENHFNINAKCENVSRSKREKFDILLNTFCRTDTNRRQRSVNDDSEAGESVYSDGEAEDVSVRSNRTMGDGPVLRSEFLALVARVQGLEREISQGMSQATPRTMPVQTDALVSSSMGAGIQPSRPYGHYTFDTGAGPSNSRPAGLQGGIGGIGAGTVHYGNMAGFGQDTTRIVPDFNPSVVTRSGGMPSNHGPQPVTVTAHHSDSPAESSTGSSAYRGAPTGRVTNVAAAVSARGGGVGAGAGVSSGGVNNDNHNNNNTHNNNHNNNSNNHIMTRAQAADYGHEAISQESVNTAVRNRWYQAAEASDAMLQNVSFFDAPVDDVSFRFLDMDSQ
ncbi:hypothetical protein SLS53_007096 [Cytospora paraplurivora]|uniref:Uncharacterized protein n=1 Tax=Cytospora paraplurivora TaxID=2898453 RepID=A0AAN9YE36_9PEZI